MAPLQTQMQQLRCIMLLVRMWQAVQARQGQWLLMLQQILQETKHGM
jgi:hypothetical protein